MLSNYSITVSDIIQSLCTVPTDRLGFPRCWGDIVASATHLHQLSCFTSPGQRGSFHRQHCEFSHSVMGGVFESSKHRGFQYVISKHNDAKSLMRPLIVDDIKMFHDFSSACSIRKIFTSTSCTLPNSTTSIFLNNDQPSPTIRVAKPKSINFNRSCAGEAKTQFSNLSTKGTNATTGLYEMR